MTTHVHRSLVLALLAGCGSVSMDPPAMEHPDANPPPSDVATDAALSDAPIDAPIDAPVSGPPCDLAKPFGTPVSVAGVSSAGSEMWGWLSADRLTIYFDRLTGNESYNIFSATRAHVGDPFSNVTEASSSVNSSEIEARPVTTANGLLLLFESTQSTGGDIYMATRTSTSDAFADAFPINTIATSGNESNPWISPDGLVLYYASKPMNGNADIVRASRSSNGFYTAEGAVPAVNTSSDDWAPVLSDDGLEMYFASNRTGKTEMFRTTRASTTDNFGAPVAVTELNGGPSQFPSWLSPDHCQLMFTSDRSDGSGDFDIWLATRPQ